MTFDDVGRAKPEPDIFLEFARRLSIRPTGCLVFEDSREGLEAARRAGMRSIDVAAILQDQITGKQPPAGQSGPSRREGGSRSRGVQAGERGALASFTRNS